MADHTTDGGGDDLYSKPSGNPYAILSAHDEDDGRAPQKPTDEQKHAYIRNLQDPCAYDEVFGDIHAISGSETVRPATQQPTDTPKHASEFKVGAEPQQSLLFANSVELEELTAEKVLKVLQSHLPKSSRASDRKAINNIVSGFVARCNILRPEQKKFVKRRLLSMEPEGGRQLEAARTTPDSIRSVLEKLLYEAERR